MASSPPAPAILRTEEGLLIGVRVSPSAPRTAFRGLYGERIKVALSAPPEDNRANAELVKVLAAWLGLPQDCVRLQSGHASRDKTVLFSEIGEDELRAKLSGLLEEGRAAKGRSNKGEGRHGS